MGNKISHGQTLRDVPSEHLLSAASIAQHSYPIGQLVITPMYPVSRPIRPTNRTVGWLVMTPMYSVGHPINPTTLLLANWWSLQHTLLAAPSTPSPHCWPTGDHPKHTVSQLVITPMYPVGRPISPTTPLWADWSSLQCTLSADLLLVLLLCGWPRLLNRC